MLMQRGRVGEPSTSMNGGDVVQHAAEPAHEA